MHDISLETGTVLTAVPYMNSYLVDVKGVGRVLSVSGEEGSADRRGSTGGPTGYLPGTQVLLGCPKKFTESSMGQVLPYVIICAFSIFTKPENTEFIPQEGAPNPSDFNNSEVANILIDSSFEKIMRQDRSYNSLLDSLPGDWQKINASGAFIRLSQFLAQVGAGPDCGITFNGLDRSLRMTFDNLVKEAASFSEVINAADDAPMAVRQYAINATEGLGVLTEGTLPFEEDDEGNYVKVAENQKSYFRHVIMEGGGSEGGYSFTQYDTSDQDIDTFDNTKKAGLTAVNNRADGIYRVKAAKEVSIRKTGNIQVPIQTSNLLSPIEEIPETAENPYDGLTDDEAKIQAFSLDDYEELTQVYPLLYAELEDFEDHNLLLNPLKEKNEWTYPSPDQEGTKIADPTEAKLPSLSKEDPEYTLEKLQGLIQEAIELLPGRKIKLWKNESAFVMFEDGSLIIEDGFGAGIKMGKGNLTLTAAADIKLLPGRDIISMAPGKTVIKSKDRVDVSSSEKSLTLKAEENLQAISGNSGKGSLILENRGSGDISQSTKQQAEKGDALGGGIYLKSYSGLSLLGNSLYAGAYSKDADSESGIARESNNCNITLDSGSGMMHFAGGRGSMLMDSALEIGHRQSASGIYFSGSSVAIAADSLGVISSLLQIGKGSGKINRTQVTKQGTKYTAHSLPSSEPSVQLFGSLRASGDIGAVGNIATEKRLLANEGADYEPRPRAQYLDISMPTENPTVTQSLISSYAGPLRSALNQQIRSGMLSEKGHAYAEAVYPSSLTYGINTSNTYFEESKWQRLLSSPGSWDEVLITSAILGDTYPYPGKEVYEEDAQIILGVEDSGKVNRKKFSDYKTNT
jgi:hypothetical protein